MSSQATSPVSSPQPSPFEHMLRLASGYMGSSAFYVAAKLKIADLLASGAKSSAELAAATGTNEDALYRTLRLLVSMGVFTEVGLRYFHNNQASELLRTDVPDSSRDILLWMASPMHNRVYAEVMHSVKTGEPAVEKATGVPCFEYFQHNEEHGAEFNAGMTGFSAISVPAVLEAYDFSGIGTLVDVAGGHGFLLSSILQKYPQMHGVLFDLPHVLEGARPMLERMDVVDRCGTATGDFFQQIPAGGDVYMMQHIIHDWDDGRAVTILQNTRRALGAKPNGRVLLLEDIIEPGNEFSFAKMLDFEMLLMPGGRERTEEEFGNLFARSGFRLNRVLRTNAPINVIEGVAI